jgi:hypothetical protein
MFLLWLKRFGILYLAWFGMYSLGSVVRCTLGHSYRAVNTLNPNI